jgi:hypothetical protein
MNDIYDVFRMLVQRSRNTMADTEVEEALTIIDTAAAARTDAVTAAVEANARILANQAAGEAGTSA